MFSFCSCSFSFIYIFHRLQEDLENRWAANASQISAILAADTIALPEEEHPIPFDAVSEKSLEEQK